MPQTTTSDDLLIGISTSSKADLKVVSIPAGRSRNKVTVDILIRQVTTDRLVLAASYLRSGDDLLFKKSFRSSISRHYYAMYHGARAIVFGSYLGDDYQKHSILPRNLPMNLLNRVQLETVLVGARLMRNSADYDIYPIDDTAFQDDARQLAATASSFVQACDLFADNEGLKL